MDCFLKADISFSHSPHPVFSTPLSCTVCPEYHTQSCARCRQPAPYRGFVRTAAGVVREEGARRLWQGVTPAIYRHLIYSGVRMNGYEWLRDRLAAPARPLPVW